MAPTSPQALLMAALDAHQQGRWGDALRLCDQLIAEQPGFANGYAVRGAVLTQLGRLADAAGAMRRFAELLPGDPNAQQAYGQALLSAGEREQAAAVLSALIAKHPNHVPALLTLGQAMIDLGRHAEGAKAWSRALPLLPANHPPDRRTTLIANLGAAYSDAGDLAAALPLLKQGAVLSPGHQGRQLNYAKGLIAAGQLDEAASVIRSAMPLGLSARAHQDLATILGEQGYIEAAIEHQRKAMAIEPTDARHHSNLLLSLRYSDQVTPQEVAAEHRKFGERFPKVAAPHANVRDPEKRLRLGYLSPDFCRHPVASFIEGVLRSHDRAQFELVAYDCGHRQDDVTARLRRYFDQWHALPKSLSDDAAAALIRLHELDILIDLSGHTSGNRLPILARRPAPLQGLYLGYPGTTGMTQVDFFVSDSVVDPAGSESLYTERLVRIEGRPFLAFGPDESAPPVAELPALSKGHLTFGALGNLAKVTPTTIALWGRVLAAVTGSKLVVRARAGGSAAAQKRIIDELTRAGVPVDRVRFLPWAAGESRWDLYREIDVGLDSFPYQGTTTTCESLWMGVPTLSVVGRVHASRVGLTIARAVGLEEFACESEEAVVKQAWLLVGDLGKLAELRRSLRDRLRASPLLDASGLTRGIERNLRALWRERC